MKRFLPLLAGAALVLASGVLHGVRTERWGPAAATAAAVGRLPELPLHLGDWRGEAIETDPARFRAAGCAGYLARRYVRERDGRGVALLLLCGHPGSIAVHTPELCYPMQGYDLLAAPRSATVADGPGRSGVFRVADFAPPDAATRPGLRIFWSWSDGGGWQTPANPRLAFALTPVLYKLYVIRPLTSTSDAADPTAVDFLNALLPEVDKVVARDVPGPS